MDKTLTLSPWTPQMDCLNGLPLKSATHKNSILTEYYLKLHKLVYLASFVLEPLNIK